VAEGGLGQCELSINLYNEPSDWQLSKVYVCNAHPQVPFLLKLPPDWSNSLNSAEPSYDVYIFFSLEKLTVDVKHLENYYT
jgi:hypothetical protein